jgi:uncharacterized membrane protein
LAWNEGSTVKLAAGGITLVALLAAFAASDRAAAEFNVCNETKSRVGVAIGHQAGDEWTTEGWWTVAPGACETILPAELTGRYYYIMARDWDKGGDWGGATPMCVQTKVFTIAGIEGCAERGFETTGFFEVDTGNAPNWTVELTEDGAE